MKLAICVLLSLAALVTADSNGYQQYQNYQNYPNYPHYDGQSAPSNYYQGDVATAQRRRSIFDSVRDFFFPGNRRQDGIGGVGVGGLVAAAAGFAVVTVIVVAVVAAASDFSSSGRGLDTDEWEVDHSVWMNQLQKDFEDSWSTQ